MNDVELYRQLLGIPEPWKVSRVVLALERGAVEVFVEHRAGTKFACPKCGTSLAVYDHTEERVWRHLDSCQYQTLLHARLPRIECKEHGVMQAAVPWAEPRSRFTALFERFAIDVLGATDIANGARILRITWDEAFGIMERAVKRGRARKGDTKPTRIAVDEKSPGKRAAMFTVVSDLDRKTVEFVGDGHRAESLDAYWAQCSRAQLEAITTIGMDMSDAYYGSAMRAVPDAVKKIVFDRFHVMQHASAAVDQVRRNEHAALHREQDHTLKGSRFLWLYSVENVPEKYKDRFEALRRSTLATGRAWVLKEQLRWLWAMWEPDDARTWLTRWIRRTKRTGLAPLVRLAATVKRHLPNILTYLTHRITSATAEGLNSAIQAIKVRARGYRNRENFKTAIYFHLGGLDLYPELPAQTA